MIWLALIATLIWRPKPSDGKLAAGVWVLVCLAILAAGVAIEVVRHQ